MHKPVVFLDIDRVLNSKRWYAQDAASHEGISPTERNLWERSIDHPKPVCCLADHAAGLPENTQDVIPLDFLKRKSISSFCRTLNRFL